MKNGNIRTAVVITHKSVVNQKINCL